MISHIDITGIRYDADEPTKRYIRKKIGRLERYVPRHSRASVHAEVIIRHIDKPRGNKYEVEATIKVPEKTLTAKDSTTNVLAATDIVEAKLSSQLRRYKTERVAHIGNRRVLSHFKRSYAREAQ